MGGHVRSLPLQYIFHFGYSHICVYLETQKLASDTALEVVEVAVKFIVTPCNILLEFLFPPSQF